MKHKAKNTLAYIDETGIDTYLYREYGRSLRGELVYDEFAFYDYEFPKWKTAVISPDSREEIETVKIGLYDEYRDGKINKKDGSDHYGIWGRAKDENGRIYSDMLYLFVIRNDNGCGKNLLLIGDSNMLPMRDSIAYNFNTTVQFDYRILSKLPVDYIINKYSADVLLFCAQSPTWGGVIIYSPSRRKSSNGLLESLFSNRFSPDSCGVILHYSAMLALALLAFILWRGRTTLYILNNHLHLSQLAFVSAC